MTTNDDRDQERPTGADSDEHEAEPRAQTKADEPAPEPPASKPEPESEPEPQHEEDEEEEIGEAPPRRNFRPIAIAVACITIIAGVLLFKDLKGLGIWDPYELGLADIGCRKAANAGAFDLSKCGLDANAKVTDIRPVVMVQSVAWGFRLLGVSEAAGRVPLALWALLGVIAVTLAVSRLVDARAGLFTGAALVTMPLYLVQGRLILGDAATMGAFAIALSGLAVAAFDRRDDGTPTSWGERAPWALLGALGVAAGIGCRGYAVGCAPAAAIGLAWLVRTANVTREDDSRAPLLTLLGVGVFAAAIAIGIKLAPGELGRTMLQPATTRALAAAAIAGAAALAWVKGTSNERAHRAFVGAALAVGVLGVAVGVTVALTADEGKFVAAVGATAQATRKYPTFDLLVRQVAHGLFPWSCFVPFALGRAMARPAVSHDGAASREIDLRIAALVAAALVYAVQTLASARFGIMPFAGPVALAIVIGVVLRDLERSPAGSLAVAIGTTVLAFLVLNDFNFEDLAKSPVELATAPIIEPYGLYGVSIPEELRLKLKTTLVVAAGVFLLPIFFVWVDEDPRPGWTPVKRIFTPIDKLVAMWRHPYQGLLLLLLASFEVCIGIAGLLTWRKGLRKRIPQLQGLGIPQRDILVNLWWYLLAAAVAVYVGYVLFLYGRDLFRSLRRMRVATIAIGGLAAGCVFSYGVMPAVANQFSPKGVFATYRSLGAGKPIALLGLNARTAAYDLESTTPVVVDSPRAAYEWLTKGDVDRKFLALRVEHLAELNRLFREKAEPRINLPILDGRSAQVLLASNLLSGHGNENPLDRLVLSDVPTATTGCENDAIICAPSHALDCDIDGKLACVGWDLLDANNKPISAVQSGQKVKLRVIYKVTGKPSGGWQIFIHVEQPGTATARKTSDHVPLNGKYPMDAWAPGDVVVDDSEFNLEPNMRSGAAISILTGFFSGNSRLPLVRGPDAGPEQEGLRLVLGNVMVK